MSSKYPSKAAMMRHEKMEMEMEYGKKAAGKKAVGKKKSTAKAAGKKKKK